VPQPQQSVPTNLLYYLVSFLVGYREETFRELIKRLVDVILSSGRPAGAVPTIHVVNPSAVRHDLPSQVVVSGSGFTSTRSVRFGNLLARYTINSDGQLTATTPALPAAGPVPLTVITNRGSATREFTFT
jgi:hypothetical protein